MFLTRSLLLVLGFSLGVLASPIECPILECPILECPILECPVLEKPALGRPLVERPVVVTLVDGSTLHGTTVDESWQLESAIGPIVIPLRHIRRIERTAEVERSFAVHLHNGDRISGELRNDRVEVITIIGDLALPFDRIASIDVSAIAPAVPRRGPILHHDLRGYLPNEHRGRVADLSGNDRTGRFVGADLRAPGVLEQSYFEHPFNANSPLFPTDTPFSVVVTFRTNCREPGEMMLWSTHYAGSGTDGGWLQVDTKSHGGRMRFFVGPRHTEIVGESVANDGEWHTVVASWDGKTMRLIVDGELEGTAPSAGPLSYGHRSPLRIGHTTATGAAHAQREKYFFRGEIGEVWIYDRALEVEEWRGLTAQPGSRSDQE